MQSDTIKEIDDSREKENLKKLEAVFFVSGRFLNMQELISFTDFSPVIIQELIEKLQERYGRDDSAIEIVSTLQSVPRDDSEGMSTRGKNEMWKMDVKQEHVDVINRLATGSSEFSNAEKETLAIIAYKQPIKQSVIIKIRGNKAYDHIKKFVELGLLRKKKMGHTNILTLADEFYDYFNLNENSNPLQEGEGSAQNSDLPQESLKEENPDE
jgi:segregation and condensation protein B